MADNPVLTTVAAQSPYSRWKTELEYARKELKTFHKRARRVVKKFLDERDSSDDSAKWFNIFYANVEILESALYAQLPKPTVSRKYLDYKDDVGRVAAMIIERCITQDLDDPEDNFDSTLRQCVQDRLVPGLAQAWLRLETDTEEVPPVSIPPMPGMDPQEPIESQEPMQQIVDQRVCVDYIFWQDFLWSPCRVWSERRWVARDAYMVREELIKRFGDKIGSQVPLNHRTTLATKDENNSTPTNMAFSTARVTEIWDRVTKKVIWFCEDYPEILDTKDDILGLKGFEPCPKPMFANLSTSNTTPRPDYFMIQDQYSELDNINNRISILLEACKVIGVYDKGAEGIQRMLKEGFENELIPVDNWAMFAEKGGIKGQIDWLPLDSVVQAIQQLNAAREVIKGQIYELTGIADIVRGASKASETLGAQQIKAQFASVRIKKLQDEVARFASEIMRIKAEIQVKHFSAEMLVKKSNIAETDNLEHIEAALALLKDASGFEWRIQITADTLAQADYAMEKADRIAFLSSVSAYLQSAGSMVMQKPETAPALIGMLKWAVAGFRNARDIEGMLDKSLDALSRQPPTNEPSPEEVKAKAETQKLQMEMEAFKQKTQIEQQSAQADFANKQQEAKLDQMQKMFELKLEQQRLQMEMAADQRRLEMEERQQKMELMFQQMLQAIKLRAAEEMAEVKQEQAVETSDD